MSRVHVLEGHSATGQRYYRCGRTGRANGPSGHVGWSALKPGSESWLRVTCRDCQRAIARRWGVPLTELRASK